VFRDTVAVRVGPDRVCVCAMSHWCMQAEVSQAYATQATATFVAASPMSNAAQHVTISPAAYGIPPGYSVAPGGQAVPQYASYVIDPNLVVGPGASGGMHMM